MVGNKVKIYKNLIFSMIAQIMTIALGLIIPRITIVGYGSSVNGLLSSVSQIIAYLVLFEAGIKAVAQQAMYKTLAKSDFTATNQILAAVNKNYTKIGLMYFIGLMCISLIYPFVIDVEGLNFISVATIVLFSGLGNVLSFFVTGKYNILIESDGRAYILTNLGTIISIVSHIIKIFLIYMGVPVVTVVVTTFIIYVIQNIYVFRYVKTNYDWIDISVTPNMKSLEQSNHAFVHQVSTLILRNTDILILTLFCDLKIVSVYAMYKLILGYLGNFLSVPLNSCNFAMGQLFNRDRTEYKKRADALEVSFMALVFAIMTTTAIMILPFLRIYTSGISDVNYVDKYIAILFIAAELLDLIRMPCLRTINYAKHYKQTLSRSIIESSINLIVSIVGVIYMGIYGVLLGTVIALSYRTIDIIIYANKKVLEKKPLKSIACFAINLVLIVLIPMGYSLLNIKITNFWDFIVVGLIVTPTVGIIYFLVNFLFFKKDIIGMLSFIQIKRKIKE